MFARRSERIHARALLLPEAREPPPDPDERVVAPGLAEGFGADGRQDAGLGRGGQTEARRQGGGQEKGAKVPLVDRHDVSPFRRVHETAIAVAPGPAREYSYI